MNTPRIGELLSKLVPLTHHDIEEILQEQRGSKRRFGEIALAWGLCQPEHIWAAWYKQIEFRIERIDLRTFGIDSQALSQIPRDMVMQYQMIPVRASGEQLIVAVPNDVPLISFADVVGRLGKDVRLVMADADQIREAIEQYYGALRVSA